MLSTSMSHLEKLDSSKGISYFGEILIELLHLFSIFGDISPDLGPIAPPG